MTYPYLTGRRAGRETQSLGGSCSVRRGAAHWLAQPSQLSTSTKQTSGRHEGMDGWMDRKSKRKVETSPPETQIQT